MYELSFRQILPEDFDCGSLTYKVFDSEKEAEEELRKIADKYEKDERVKEVIREFEAGGVDIIYKCGAKVTYFLNY